MTKLEQVGEIRLEKICHKESTNQNYILELRAKKSIEIRIKPSI